MNFNRHSDLDGKHALLSPSRHSWLNYDPDKLVQFMCASYATTIGTLLHAYAAERITHRMRLRKSDHDNVIFELLRSGIPEYAVDIERIYPNLMLYVNDAIGFRMQPEVVLYGTDNCFGTADAICMRDGILRIHDLKTGVSLPSMDQLIVYAALFFMEYPQFTIDKTQVELRIYHSDDVMTDRPDSESIREVMNLIVESDRVIENFKLEG